MFKKIMKSGGKKPSKSDSNDPSRYGNGPPVNRSPASANVGVNKVGAGASVPNFGGPPPSGAMEPLPLFRDVPVSERQNLFLRKL